MRDTSQPVESSQSKSSDFCHCKAVDQANSKIFGEVVSASSWTIDLPKRFEEQHRHSLVSQNTIFCCLPLSIFPSQLNPHTQDCSVSSPAFPSILFGLLLSSTKHTPETAPRLLPSVASLTFPLSYPIGGRRVRHGGFSSPGFIAASASNPSPSSGERLRSPRKDESSD